MHIIGLKAYTTLKQSKKMNLNNTFRLAADSIAVGRSGSFPYSPK